MSNKSLYSYPGEGGLTISSGFFVLGLFFLLGIACLFAANLTGVIVGMVLLILPFYIVSRAIKSVDFFETSITINYFGLRKPAEIDYEQVKSIRPHTQPRTWERIFVAEINGQKPIKKFTWHCSDKEFDKMRQFLIDRKVRIVRE